MVGRHPPAARDRHIRVKNGRTVSLAVLRGRQRLRCGSGRSAGIELDDRGPESL
jgi:hypothetical protein